MNEVIERACRAAYMRHWFAADFLAGERQAPVWEHASDQVKAWVREGMCAAIAELREPSAAMAAAGKNASLAEGAHDCEVPMSDVWRAMVDALLGAAKVEHEEVS